MTTWAPWLILSVIVLALLRLFFSKAEPPPVEVKPKIKYRFRKRQKLCTANEAKFFHALNKAAGYDVSVFCKVRVTDVLAPRSDLSIENWNHSFDRIEAERFDYVLCSTSGFSIICVLNLVKNNSPKSRTKRFLQKACKSASIPAMEFKIEERYSSSTIRRKLKQALPGLLIVDIETPKSTSADKKAKTRKQAERMNPKLSTHDLLLREEQRRLLAKTHGTRSRPH